MAIRVESKIIAKRKPGAKYPCHAPLSQLYVLPRSHLDLRFCCYHGPIYVKDQERFFAGGVDELRRFFSANAELVRRRGRFLEEDFEGAGCPKDCFWYAEWKATGQGYDIEDFETEGHTPLSRLWISVGPDCNATCRYCLEPKIHEIDYNTCSVSVMDVARDFVEQGGEILITGGEPFLPKFKLAKTLVELSEESRVTGGIEFHTNGSYLSEDVRRAILNGPVFRAHVSMDTLRPELFEFLRRGCKFSNVWENVKALRRERDERGLDRPEITILCAVMKANYDHVAETCRQVVAEGLAISLNSLFKAYFAPDFCREQGLHNLTLAQCGKVYEDILSLEAEFGTDGPIHLTGFKGQLTHLIEAKKGGEDGEQIALGGGGEAPRKAGRSDCRRRSSVVEHLRRGEVVAAAGSFIDKMSIARGEARTHGTLYVLKRVLGLRS